MNLDNSVYIIFSIFNWGWISGKSRNLIDFCISTRKLNIKQYFYSSYYPADIKREKDFNCSNNK